MVSARAVVERSDDFDVLSATWIMSCNDENPIITYRGIAYRSGCDEDKAKSLVRSRPELFRPGVPFKSRRGLEASVTSRQTTAKLASGD